MRRKALKGHFSDVVRVGQVLEVGIYARQFVEIHGIVVIVLGIQVAFWFQHMLLSKRDIPTGVDIIVWRQG